MTTEWRDGERRLEEQMNEVVSVFSIAGPILQDRRRQAEEAERRRWEEERRRQEEPAKRQQDENRRLRFVKLAAQWKEAALAAHFIEALQELPADNQKTFGGKTASKWLAWAREKCVKFDPPRWEPGDVWGNLASVNSWDYRE